MKITIVVPLTGTTTEDTLHCLNELRKVSDFQIYLRKCDRAADQIPTPMPWKPWISISSETEGGALLEKRTLHIFGSVGPNDYGHCTMSVPLSDTPQFEVVVVDAHGELLPAWVGEIDGVNVTCES